MTLGTKISAVAKYLTVRMQSNAPLTLTLSPSDGERGWFCPWSIVSAMSDFGLLREFFSLSPSDVERVGGEGKGELHGDGLVRRQQNGSKGVLCFARIIFPVDR